MVWKFEVPSANFRADEVYTNSVYTNTSLTKRHTDGITNL
jgi:hypothetical protein